MRRDLQNASVILDSEVSRYFKLLVIVITYFSYFTEFRILLTRWIKYYTLLLVNILIFSYKHWIKSEGIVMSSFFYFPGAENISHNNFIMDNFLDIDADFCK